MARMKELELAEESKIELSMQTQSYIQRLYRSEAKAARQRAESIPEYGTVSDSIRKQYWENYAKDLDVSLEKISAKIEGRVKSDMLESASFITTANVNFMERVGLKVDGAFAYVPERVIERLVSGDVYRSDWTLSGAVWKNHVSATSQAQKIIAQGLASQKPTYDIAKDLELFLDPKSIKPWDWSKVYPGVHKKVDYAAQRLARTMIQHSYQLALRETVKNNPFVEGIMWHSVYAHGRTCELCMERDGTVYAKGKEPLDHPNGLCYFTPEMPDSLETIADRLSDWVKGKDDAELDKFAISMYGGKTSAVNKVLDANAPSSTPKTLKHYASHLNKYKNTSDATDSIEFIRDFANDNDLPEDFVEQVLNHVVNNSSYKMRIPSGGILEKIVSDNKFKTQFETNTSKGALDHGYRKKATRNMFGAVIKELDNGDFEKYGYIGAADHIHDLRGGYGPTQYGKIIIEFDKEKLKDRVTFTIGDSLGPALGECIIPTKPESINVFCIEEWQRLRNVNMKALKRAYENHVLTNDVLEPQELTDVYLYTEYIEAQYHGDLDLSHVKTIVFPDEYTAKSELKNSYERLKELNISIKYVDNEEIYDFMPENL